MQIGTNCANINYWGSEDPFLNKMKSSGAWQGSTPVEQTADGYPLELPAGAKDTYCMVPVKPGTYELRWKGTASINMMGTKVISTAPGRIVFERLATNEGSMLLAISGVDRRDPLSDMAIVRVDQLALYDAGQIYNPEFLAVVPSVMGTLRQMDWMATNVNPRIRWEERTRMSARSWSGDGPGNHVPIEAIVVLANLTKTNLWITVPTYADDDHVRQMATYIRDNLDKSLTVHFEWSNEVWNWLFQQAGYAHRQAALLWGQDMNKDGVIDPNDPAEQYGAGWVTYLGYRATQIARIIADVFAADRARLKNVIGLQLDWCGVEQYVLDGMKRAGLTKPNEVFDEYAVTTYFHGNLTGANEADIATLRRWAEAGDVAPAIEALRTGKGMTAQDSGSLAQRHTVVFPYHAKMAKEWGLDLVAYEGGKDLNGNGRDAVVTAYLQKVAASPEMYAIYVEMTTSFAGYGATLMCVLIDVDPGFWGHLKSLDDKNSPAWQALVDWQAKVETPKPTPPKAPTKADVDKAMAAVKTATRAVRGLTEQFSAALAAVDKATETARDLLDRSRVK